MTVNNINNNYKDNNNETPFNKSGAGSVLDILKCVLLFIYNASLRQVCYPFPNIRDEETDSVHSSQGQDWD